MQRRRTMWRALALALLVIGTAGCWPHIGGDAANRNHNDFETRLTVDTVAGLSQRWSAPGTVDAVWGRQVIGGEAGGTGAADGGFARIRSLDAATGAEIWERPLATGVFEGSYAQAAVVGGHVWAGWSAFLDAEHASCSAGSARLDLTTGAVVEALPGPQYVVGVRPYGDPVAGNVVASFRNSTAANCMLNTEHVTRVQDAASGAERWRVDGLIAAVSGGRIITASGSTLRAFDAAGCGAPVCPPSWSQQLFVGQVVGGVGDRLYAMTFDFAGLWGVLALDGSDGSEDWRLTGSDVPWLTVDGDRVIVASGDDVTAYSDVGCGPAPCAPEWTGTLPAQVSGNPVSAAGVVYVPTADGSITAFPSAGCASTPCTPLASLSVAGRPERLVVSGGVLFVQTARVAPGRATVTAFGLG
jgi:PQQ-like domain